MVNPMMNKNLIATSYKLSLQYFTDVFHDHVILNWKQTEYFDLFNLYYPTFNPHD